MSKLPSDATKLRNMNREFSALQKAYRALLATHEAMRVRATFTEQQAKEWRERFDILLRREDRKP